MKLFDLTGRKAIVTGATRGLGRGMAEGLMEAGCEVVVVGSSDTALKVAQEFAERGFRCHGIAIDLADRARREEGFAQAVELLGGHLDILVNGAGIQRRHFCEEFPIEDWDDVLEVNLTATFQLCQLAGRQFIRQNSRGKIVNIASMLSFFGGFTVPAYAASKGGVAQLTKALSNEWSGKNIQVNAIACGLIHTEMNLCFTEEERRSLIEEIPADRMGNTAEVAQMVCSVLSMPSYATGQIFTIDGGWR